VPFLASAFDGVSDDVVSQVRKAELVMKLGMAGEADRDEVFQIVAEDV